MISNLTLSSVRFLTDRYIRHSVCVNYKNIIFSLKCVCVNNILSRQILTGEVSIQTKLFLLLLLLLIIIIILKALNRDCSILNAILEQCDRLILQLFIFFHFFVLIFFIFISYFFIFLFTMRSTKFLHGFAFVAFTP